MRPFTVLIYFLVCFQTHRSLAQETIIFQDPRDGQEYEIAKIKIYQNGTYQERFWFADNLNYQTENSRCYKGYDTFCESFGRLYSWFEARSACPSGWHISTFTDWFEMTRVFGGLKKAGRLIQKNKLNIRMGGFGEPNGEFYDLGLGAYFWDDETRIIGTAGSINVLSNTDEILHQRVFGYHMNSIRCVKDY